MSLNGNQIGPIGALALARMINNNPQIPLQSLDLYSGQIGNAGTKALAKAIGKNIQLPLQHLNLGGPKINQAIRTQIDQLLKRNHNQPH